MRYILMLIALLLISACANRSQPIVDTQGINWTQYNQDLYECSRYAEQVKNKAPSGMVGGAVVGAAVGSIVGNSKTAQKGAAVGALSGFLKGANRTKVTKNQVVKRCLSQRGYRVLN